MRSTILVIPFLGLIACNEVASDPRPAAEGTPATPPATEVAQSSGPGMVQAAHASSWPLLTADLHLGNLVAGAARLTSATEHNFEVEEADGIHSLYSGKDVGLKARTAAILTADAIGGFARVQVPAAIVARARTAKQRTVTLSLEDPQSAVEVVLHQAGKDWIFRAGDPWVSGIVQVVISENGTPLGLYRIVRHHPPASAEGAIGSSYFETGIFEDVGLPALKYFTSSTRQWPSLPAAWLQAGRNLSAAQ
jgi:hypothetical protein